MRISTETYYFYEWLIIEKKITDVEFKKLTVSEIYGLKKEYDNFRRGLRCGRQEDKITTR